MSREQVPYIEPSIFPEAKPTIKPGEISRPVVNRIKAYVEIPPSEDVVEDLQDTISLVDFIKSIPQEKE